MKNDLDFIRNKIENDGVKAPGDMDESFVLEALADAEQKKAKKPRRKAAAIAASLAVVTVAGVAAAAVIPQLGSNGVKKTASDSLVRHFESYAQLKAELKKIGKTKNNDSDYILYSTKTNDVGESAAGDTYAGKAYAETNVQVDGVDEADIIKTDGNYIYTVSDSAVTIFSAKGKASKKLKTFSPFGKNGYGFELFVNDNRLTVVGTQYRERSVSTPDEVRDFAYVPSAEETVTRVISYDISDVKNVKKVDEFSQSGDYVSARITGGRLILVSQTYARSEDYIPYYCCGGKKSNIPADSIYCVENPGDDSFVNVSSYDFNTGTNDTKSILGVAENIYCTSDNLYVYSYNGYFGFYRGAAATDGDDTTRLIRFSLGDRISVAASGKIKGRIYDRYALDEKDGKLRVATTSLGKNDKEENNLYVLSDSLKKLGSVTGFAKNESVKAVKYVGDTAYVITYEQTDPLFVIDVGDSANPKILGEAKITGFSSVLVPVDENTLLGIGYNTDDSDIEEIGMEVTDGVKLALFDVSDKLNPKVLDSKVFKEYYSAAQDDPRAVVINEERGCVTIPFWRDNWNEADPDTDEYFTESGAITFSVRDGKLIINDEFVSNKIKESYSPRATYVGDDIYIVDTDSAVIDSVKYK